MGVSCKLAGHKWPKKQHPIYGYLNDGCICERCGERNPKIQDPMYSNTIVHNWKGCICMDCGLVDEAKHEWAGDPPRCVYCGKPVPSLDSLLDVICEGLTDNKEKSLAEQQLKAFYAADPTAPVAAYKRLGAWSLPESAKQTLEGIIFELRNDELYRHLAQSGSGVACLHEMVKKEPLIKDQISDACKDLPTAIRKTVFERCQIIDGVIIKNRCDVGDHDFERVRTYWPERSQTADSYDRRYEKKVLRCKRCGFEVEKNTGNWD